jgi:hypothetical protein
LLASTACNSCLLHKRARKHADHLGHGRMLVPVGPIRIILQIVKFKKEQYEYQKSITRYYQQ